jgi:hypothetical protein
MSEQSAQLSFRCEGCQSLVNVQKVTLYRDGLIFFSGNCSGCDLLVKVPSSMAELQNTILGIPKSVETDAQFLKRMGITDEEAA